DPEKVTEEEIREALATARLDHFVDSLPEGIDTRLESNASNLSAGQRQLLTIARAILRKPAVLILDEATSSVDTRTEQAIQMALSDVMKNRTSFLIAHRLSTIRHAGVILVMEEGHIVEQGDHETLIAKQGAYWRLYRSQFLGKEE
ncbi:MAG: ATP-binding cassette domain-containing protein, partial [Clostridia bacterium]|nr:ATP-binding cassette domain-containing protein [Clostridia bacterium]